VGRRARAPDGAEHASDAPTGAPAPASGACDDETPPPAHTAAASKKTLPAPRRGAAGTSLVPINLSVGDALSVDATGVATRVERMAPACGGGDAPDDADAAASSPPPASSCGAAYPPLPERVTPARPRLGSSSPPSDEAHSD
jgi:hypothetical protein